MASSSLAIAKASFAASLTKPDPASVTKAEISKFHSMLDEMLQHCSSTNIQLCKEWLLKNVLSSSGRTISLGKFLVARSESFGIVNERRDNSLGRKDPPPPQKQLHILYLLHDSLHHARHHVKDATIFPALSTKLHDHIYNIVKIASNAADTVVKLLPRLQALIEVWEDGSYFDHAYIQQLREATLGAAHTGHLSNEELSGSNDQGNTKKQPAFIMPSTHGDISTAFYDLPAANMMPHIIPNSINPINPQLVKPLRFTAGPADQELIFSVNRFLKDIESATHYSFEGEEQRILDIDGMGQFFERENAAANYGPSESYYGWSQDFCEKMRRGEEIEAFSSQVQNAHDEERSPSPRKRRRYSYSESGSSRSRSRSRSRRGSPSAPHFRTLRSQSRSYSPPSPPTASAFQLNPATASNGSTAVPRQRSPPSDPRRSHLQAQHGPTPSQPALFLPSLDDLQPPMDLGGTAIPPRPHNWNGSWPPPPPPPNGPRPLHHLSDPAQSFVQMASPVQSKSGTRGLQRQHRSTHAQAMSYPFSTSSSTRGKYSAPGQYARGGGNARGAPGH